MKKSIHQILISEDGAVSLDWIVLTAAIVSIGVATGIAVRPAVSTAVAKVGPAAAQVSSGTSF